MWCTNAEVPGLRQEKLTQTLWFFTKYSGAQALLAPLYQPPESKGRDVKKMEHSTVCSDNGFFGDTSLKEKVFFSCLSAHQKYATEHITLEKLSNFL